MKKGTCAGCGEVRQDHQMPAHLKECAIGEPDGRGRKRFILKAVGGSWGKYWMYVAMDGTATLNDLDEFLREQWLECCGHLSAFEINGKSYQKEYDYDPFFDMPDSKDMRTKAEDVLSPGLKLKHEYDFGTPTTLTLTVHGEYADSSPAESPVDLLAKNNATNHRCRVCRGHAQVICVSCLEDEGRERFFCDRCSEGHDGDTFLPVANSPRMGECGYGD